MRFSTLCIGVFTSLGVACASAPTVPAGSSAPSGAREPADRAIEGVGDAGLEEEAKTSSNVREGTITYMTGSTIFQLDVREGAKPVNLSLKLNSLGSGTDEFLAMSRNGAFMTISTTRFSKDCSGWACLALLKGDMSEGHSVKTKNNFVRPSGRAAISNEGTRIVYASDEGPHAQDLFLLEKVEGQWTQAQLITGVSHHKYNTEPVLSEDGTRVLFDCSPVPYSQAGTGICEILVDGLLLSDIVDPSDNPLGPEGDFRAHHADYLPDGSIIFQADWAGAQLWHLPVGAEKARQVNPDISNDNRPCGLPGGYIASLWLERPGAIGVSELKISQSDGDGFSVLTPNEDVSALSCHETQN